MSYKSTLANYRALLADRPGQALEIDDGCFAVLVDDNLFGVQADDKGQVNTDNSFDFDISAWDDENDCWDADVTAMQTSNAIANPRFVEIKKS